MSGWRVTATPRHFFLDQEPVRHLREAGCEFVDSGWGHGEADSTLGGDELVSTLSDVDAAVIGGCKLSAPVLQRLPRLKVLARRGVGYETVDVLAATARGIVITITPGANSNAVADHAFALLLAVCRNLLEGHLCVSEGGWRAFMGTELWGKTLGIVGLGRIGKRVALRARGFGMTVLASDPVHDYDFAALHAICYSDLQGLLERSDFVSIHAPLTDDTHHLINEETLAMMKPSSVLINTARGPLVDLGALEAALIAGHLHGAGIDVFDEEPPGRVALASLPRVVVSPHTAGYSGEGIALGNLMAARSITEIMAGRLPEPDAVVNPSVWATARARAGD